MTLPLSISVRVFVDVIQVESDGQQTHIAFPELIESPPVKESTLDSDFAIHNGSLMGDFHGKKDAYDGTDHREAAAG